jgi:CRISPR-associated protein Csx16
LPWDSLNPQTGQARQLGSDDKLTAHRYIGFLCHYPPIGHLNQDRHAGSLEWLARQGIQGITVSHLEPATLDRLEAGDLVIGTLPIPLVAAVCAKGARYLHLRLDLPSGRRGEELTADEMDAFGARLQAFQALKESTPAPQGAPS